MNTSTREALGFSFLFSSTVKLSGRALNKRGGTGSIPVPSYLPNKPNRKVRNKMNKLVKVSKKFLSKNASTILTGVGAAGVVVTAVMAAKATPKAMSLIEEAEIEKGEELSKWEKVSIGGPAYIPTVMIGAATMGCIFGANILNKRSQAALMSAYALLDTTHKEYKNKVAELYGEDANSEITREIAKDYYDEEEYKDEYDDGKQLFYETFSKQYFRATNETVLRAEYEVNRLIQEEGGLSLNVYFRMLGLEEEEYGEYLGWSGGQLMEAYWSSWVHFTHEKVEMEDDMECWLIHMEFEPMTDFDEY